MDDTCDCELIKWDARFTEITYRIIPIYKIAEVSNDRTSIQNSLFVSIYKISHYNFLSTLV